MKQNRIIIQTLIFVSLIFSSACKKETEEKAAVPVPRIKQFQIVLDFEDTLQLNKDQIASIKRLVDRIGIKEVGRIKTFIHQHGGDPGINIYEKETAEGRKISYRQLYVYFKGWHNPEKFKKEKKIEEGGFWTYTTAPVLREEYILNISGRKTRIKENDGYKVSDIESIITLFLQGKYYFADSVTEKARQIYKAQLSKMDFFSPLFISGNTISFSPKGTREPGLSGWSSIEFYIIEGRIEICSILRACP